jgi:hypothetical protein
MGTTWSLDCLPSTVMDRVGVMSAALHALLSRNDIFKGACTAFAHTVSCTDGDGYLSLFQLVRMVHPALGQARAQQEQPSQSRSQPFAAHICRFIDYYQSEECSGCFYTDNEKVISIISRLQPTWRDALKRKYLTLVPQCGATPNVPSECSIPLLCVTLEQWCAEDNLALPQVASDTAVKRVFALTQDGVSLPSDASSDFPSDASVFVLSTDEFDMATVDRVMEHVV